MSPHPRQNIEIKARVDSLESVRHLAARLATEHVGVLEQVDTFFHCISGRLKVRQFPGQPAELIAYQRANTAAAKSSSYHLVKVADGEDLVAALSSSLGMRIVVRKSREVFLYHNVRIHLDRVEGLGEFIELESVVSGDVDEAKARDRLDELIEKLGIKQSDLVSVAYADLLEAKR